MEGGVAKFLHGGMVGIGLACTELDLEHAPRVAMAALMEVAMAAVFEVVKQ